MKLFRITVWNQEYERLGNGVLTIVGWHYLPKPREWGKLMVYNLLKPIDCAIALATLGFVTSEMATVWLFSDVWEED